MVWTDDQVAQFLDYAADHAPDLHPMFHFIAYRGPRRGEACGLRDSEVRLGKKEATINNQIATIGSRRVQKPPKSRAGNRDLVLDDDTAKVLAAYKARRAAWQLAAGPDRPDTGLFFVRPDGRAWHPGSASASTETGPSRQPGDGPVFLSGHTRAPAPEVPPQDRTPGVSCGEGARNVQETRRRVGETLAAPV
jgi:hypothetical protein